MIRVIPSLFVLSLVSLTGCTSTSSNALGLPSPQHRLLPQAKAFRDAGPAPDGPRELAKALHPAHVLEPGDALLVTVSDLDSIIRIPADQPILPDGTIDLAKYGRPVVAGLTVPAAEAEILRQIRKVEKDASGITVRMLTRVSKVYYVLGEVNAPGVFPLTGRETALDGILAAGGLNRRASEGKIILSRPTQPEGCRVVLPICYPQIVQLGDTTTNYQLQAGDRIYVSSRSLAEDLFPWTNKPTCACATQQVPCNRCVGVSP
jgi:polysaccharide export outer membrane protein